MAKMFRRNDEGFTLIELMVVVLIIGILIAIAIPVYNAAQASAKTSTCKANQRTIAGAAQTMNGATGAYPANVAAMVPVYVQKAPVCPAVAGGYSLNTSGGVTSDQGVAGTFFAGHDGSFR